MIANFLLQLVHSGDALYSRKMISSSDYDDFGVKLFSTKVILFVNQPSSIFDHPLAMHCMLQQFDSFYRLKVVKYL